MSKAITPMVTITPTVFYRTLNVEGLAPKRCARVDSVATLRDIR